MTGRPGGRSRRCASCHGGGKGPGSPVPWDGDSEDTGLELSAFSSPRLLPPHGEPQPQQWEFGAGLGESTLRGAQVPPRPVSPACALVFPLFLREASEVTMDAFRNVRRHIIHQIHIYNHSLN